MIGPATLGDLWTLRRAPRRLVRLYNEAMLARQHRPLWFTIRCLLEGSGRDGASFVYRDRGARALVQSVGRDGRPEQDIVLLAAYGAQRGQPTDLDVWFRLMESLCIQVGHYHVQRLYAGLSQGHEELREVFRQLGFNGYAHQTVLRLEGPDWDQGTTLAPMRPQSRRDIWAIHKLYGATAPRHVQLAEARDSRTWMLPRMLPRAQRWLPRRRGWVLGPEDNLVAYLQVISGPAAHILALLLQPEAREITTDILRFGLGQIADAQPVFLLLRDYQRELLLPAGDLGFQPIGEQALLVKQTTAAVTRPFITPMFESGLETRAPAPTISPVEGDVRPYVRTTRHYQQYRPASGSSSTPYSPESGERRGKQGGFA
jgi:hypothetical protein